MKPNIAACRKFIGASVGTSGILEALKREAGTDNVLLMKKNDVVLNYDDHRMLVWVDLDLNIIDLERG